MKPHITNLVHKKFSMLLEDTIQRLEEISIDEKQQLSEKITELKNNKQILEEIYSCYQFKLKELSHLLDDYEKTKTYFQNKFTKTAAMAKNQLCKVDEELLLIIYF